MIVGIETGNTPGRLGAVVVEVSGNGSDTVLDLYGFRSYPLPAEILATLKILNENKGFDSEEIAGINFLVLHHLSKLYGKVMDEVGAQLGDVDMIGLKCMEVGGEIFPSDPSVLSEMTNRIVASRFSIGVENGSGGFLPVRESILQGMVGDMVKRFGLESEVREAVAVALLANESLFHESSEACMVDGEGNPEARRPSLRAVKRTHIQAGGGKAVLCGEFFFPV